MHGGNMTRISAIYLFEKKESHFALKRIINLSSISAYSYLLLLCMRLHPGMTGTRGRKCHY